MMWVTLRFLSKFPLDPKSENVLSALIAETISLRTEDWVLLLHENGLLNEVDSVRLVCLKSIANLLNLGKEVPNECLILLHFAAYDENPTVAEFSRRLRTNFQLSVMSNTFSYLRPLMDSPERRIRHCSARAIAGLLDRIGFDPNIIDLDSFFNEYNSYLPPNSEKKGNTKVKSGRISIATQDGKDDGLFFREALAIFLRAVGDQRSLPPSEGRTEDLILSLVKFIVDFGSVDLDTKVRAGMVDAGRKLVDAFGLYYSDSLLELLESALQTQTDDDVYTADNKRAAIVVIMGECAKHLRANDPKVLSILLSLVEALKTPSESVQRSVADCIAPLFHTIIGTSDADRLVVLLLDQVTNGKTYGDRRGAAFGLCGAIKGLGVSSVKKYGLISKLIDYVSTGSASCRQGSLFAIECLSERMCLLFEPYIITLMPLILKSVSNSSDHVREAAKGTVRIVMKNLSTYGVKQVLTPVLASLPNETAWKSRQEAIRLLGMMAHCAPRQLAGSLPQIIPILVQSGSDIHPRVKESAKEAMQDILSVIRNPEVSHLSPTLLNGLVDPANKAKDALESLLRCEFIHAIDVASLAIIIPILSKSLRDRSGDLKKKAAIITGNIVGMVLDKRIIAPYVPHLLPGLKECLIDPIPEVRATSAKALAKLISGVGETKTEDILPWLEETMVTDNSPVERSGAAQALAEICHVLDNRRRGEIFYKSLILYHDSKSSCREGLMWYLTFLPAATGEDFCEFIEDALPVLLAGLSDDSESVCEVAMRAGQVLISRMGLSNALDILPDLLDATLSEDWRIRTSSLSLLGDLLFLIGDTKGINFSDFDETDDDMDGGYSTSESKVSLKIRSHIGNDCFYQVLSTIYIVRADVQIEIRQNALKIWKSIVSNSPKMLVDIIPTLIPHLMKLLSVESEEIRLIGGKALGEAVSKMGDRILPAVVPYLKEGLQSNDESRRQGVCAGLAEVLSACNRKQAELYVEVLIPALQFALCDKSDVVCNQAARAFMILYKIIGNQAIDEIIPVLLHQLEVDQESEESVLRGLREIVRLRPRDLLEYLLPVLLKSPISSSSAQALGVVVEVGNTQLTYHLGTIIPALVSELIIANTEAKDNSTTRLAAIKMAGNAVVGAITSFGVHEFISDVGKQMDGEVSGDRCRWGCWMVGRFISLNKSDFSDYIPILLKYVLSHAASGDVMMLEEVRDTLLAFANCVPLDKLVLHIDFIRNCINSTASTARHRTGGINYYSLAGDFLLPLLTIPKSADPFITIYLHALMNGFAELRELAAEAIAELVTMTDFSVLKPLVIKTTGPLIRVIGERFPSNVKAAILKVIFPFDSHVYIYIYTCLYI